MFETDPLFSIDAQWTIEDRLTPIKILPLIGHVCAHTIFRRKTQRGSGYGVFDDRTPGKPRITEGGRTQKVPSDFLDQEGIEIIHSYAPNEKLWPGGPKHTHRNKDGPNTVIANVPVPGEPSVTVKIPALYTRGY